MLKNMYRLGDTFVLPVESFLGPSFVHEQALFEMDENYIRILDPNKPTRSIYFDLVKLEAHTQEWYEPGIPGQEGQNWHNKNFCYDKRMYTHLLSSYIWYPMPENDKQRIVTALGLLDDLK